MSGASEHSASWSGGLDSLESQEAFAGGVSASADARGPVEGLASAVGNMGNKGRDQSPTRATHSASATALLSHDPHVTRGTRGAQGRQWAHAEGGAVQASASTQALMTPAAHQLTRLLDQVDPAGALAQDAAGLPVCRFSGCPYLAGSVA